MKQRLLVDMDGVLADVYAQFIRMEFEETGIMPQMSALVGKKEEDAFPFFDKHVRSKGFFRNAPVMENSVSRLKYLSDKYDVLIVSSATEFPQSMEEKYYWLEEHFPFITWQQMIFCGSKRPIAGDIMIDDHPVNLDNFSGRRLLFTQPHNKLIQNPSYLRINNWNDILQIL